MKKLLSLSLALILVLALSVPVFAADISKAQAEDIALRDAGYSSSQVVYLNSRQDRDDGRLEYDVEFAVNNSDGSYVEYDYEISADGRILSKDVDVERGRDIESRFEQIIRQFIEWLLSLFR